MMAIYRSRISLLSQDNVSEQEIDRRASKPLPLITQGAETQSLDLVLSSSLEWRPEPIPAGLRARGQTIDLRPPHTRREWVTALTTLFAPANTIVRLARDVMTLEAKSNESVDVFALRVFPAYSRLLVEAERTAPVNKTPHEHVFDKAMIASFENGIHPYIREEIQREDANQPFME